MGSNMKKFICITAVYNQWETAVYELATVYGIVQPLYEQCLEISSDTCLTVIADLHSDEDVSGGTIVIKEGEDIIATYYVSEFNDTRYALSKIE